MANYIPTLGTKGIYTLLAPFNTVLTPNVPYRCTAVRSLTDIISSGGNPEVDYYTPNGINTTSYLTDSKVGVYIVSLQSDSGAVVYVPSSYFTSFPDIGGVSYTTIALAINLGAIPDNLDLTYIKSKVADVITENIGIVSEVKTVVISQPTIIGTNSHVLIDAARKAKIAIAVTDYSKYLAVVKERDLAYSKIIELENYIRSKQ